MKELFRKKAVLNTFLFLLTFGFLRFLIRWTAVRIQYDIGRKTGVEISLVASSVMILLKLASDRSKRREYNGIEYGSSRWGSKKDLSPYMDPDISKNMIFSKTEFLSMDQHRTQRDCHAFVIGGTGSGKSRFYALPNIMQMNASYVVTDPNGSHLKNEGKMLEEHGYKVKVFDVEHMERSLRFNPFHYYREPEDIIRFVDMFISNTNGGVKQSGSEDMGFWRNCEKLWFMAHIAYIQETCMEEEKNINSLVLLLDNSATKEEDEDYKSPVDILFDEMEKQNPDSFAVRQYKKYKLAAGKTAKSILISVGVRLAYFDIPKVADLFSDDELDLEKLGDEKTALFLIISDTEQTYNFIAAILLDVMFNILSKVADDSPGQHLKIPVRCILDEIANIGYFPDLHNMIAVLRKRWISLELLFQNVGQLKALYKDHWETIASNCSTTLFLGGNGEETTKHVSQGLLGKATIDTVSYGSGGTSGSMGKSSYNSNEQKTGRYLLDETELAQLDGSECITCIRGLPPFKGKKYDPRTHPNYKFLADSDPRNTYSFHRGTDLSHADIRYITLDFNKGKK